MLHLHSFHYNSIFYVHHSIFIILSYFCYALLHSVHSMWVYIINSAFILKSDFVEPRKVGGTHTHTHWRTLHLSSYFKAPKMHPKFSSFIIWCHSFISINATILLTFNSSVWINFRTDSINCYGTKQAAFACYAKKSKKISMQKSEHLNHADEVQGVMKP